MFTVYRKYLPVVTSECPTYTWSNHILLLGGNCDAYKCHITHMHGSCNHIQFFQLKNERHTAVHVMLSRLVSRTRTMLVTAFAGEPAWALCPPGPGDLVTHGCLKREQIDMKLYIVIILHYIMESEEHFLQRQQLINTYSCTCLCPSPFAYCQTLAGTAGVHAGLDLAGRPVPPVWLGPVLEPWGSSAKKKQREHIVSASGG